jgi:hypothetical protein
VEGGIVNDPSELTYMLGELYAMKRRDAQLIDQLAARVQELEREVKEYETALDG